MIWAIAAYAATGATLVFYISLRGHSMPLRDITLTGLFWWLHLASAFGLLMHTARIAKRERDAAILATIKRKLADADSVDVLLERIIDAQDQLR